jgi:hypothetical protein
MSCQFLFVTTLPIGIEVGLQNIFSYYEKQYEILCKVCFTSKDVRFATQNVYFTAQNIFYIGVKE